MKSWIGLRGALVHPTEEDWMRFVARSSGLIVAGAAVWFGLASGIGESLGSGSAVYFVAHLLFPTLPFAGLAIAVWRWEWIAGWLLIATALIVRASFENLAMGGLSLPLLASGALLLALWRRSATADPRGNGLAPLVFVGGAFLVATADLRLMWTDWGGRASWPFEPQVVIIGLDLGLLALMVMVLSWALPGIPPRVPAAEDRALLALGAVVLALSELAGLFLVAQTLQQYSGPYTPGWGDWLALIGLIAVVAIPPWLLWRMLASRGPSTPGGHLPAEPTGGPHLA